MNITKNDFYTTDYYTLKRLKDGDDLIQLLNSKGLDDSINHFLIEVVNNIYNQITNPSETVNFSFQDGIEIDEKLIEILMESDEFKRIPDPIISSKLFSDAFSKFRKRIFYKDGHNDEKYFLQNKVHQWIENTLAKIIVKDERFKSYNKLIDLIKYTELLHHFYSALKRELPIEWIDAEANDWTGLREIPPNILNHISTFDKDYFTDYSEQIKRYDTNSSWEYITETTRFSGHAYFNRENGFKNSVLLSKNLGLWVKFWDNLRWPILQDIPFHYVKYPENFLTIAEELVRQKELVLKTSPQHLACILMKNYFDFMVRVQETISFYDNDDRIKDLSEYERQDDILLKGKDIYNSWQVEKLTIHQHFMASISKLLTIDEIGEWVFSYTPREFGNRNYGDIYNTEIETITKAYGIYAVKQSIEEQIINLDVDFNLQKFGFLMSLLQDKKYDESIYLKLLQVLTQFIQSDKFYWDKTFSPAYWPTLKGIGLLLNLMNHPYTHAKKLINKFKVHHEGWNISLSDYKAIEKETFVFCGVILLLEHSDSFNTKKERVSYFNEILNHIITQTRFTVFRNEDYKLPLHMLYLVVNQVYPDMKRIFEKEIIANVDNISTIIEILSNNKYELATNSKILLKKRIQLEIPFKKRQLFQREQNHDLEILERSIENLNLSFRI